MECRTDSMFGQKAQTMVVVGNICCGEDDDINNGNVVHSSEPNVCAYDLGIRELMSHLVQQKS